MTDSFLLLGENTNLRRVANTSGGEYVGSCPKCGGNDRYHVWPTPPDGKARYWCRGCGAKGDAIEYLKWMHGLSYRDACARLGIEPASRPTEPRPTPAPRPATPPSAEWRTDKKAWVLSCKDDLWGERGKLGLIYLRDDRRLCDDTIQAARLGWSHIGRVLVFPWQIDGQLWAVRTRTPDLGRSKGKDPYLFLTGSIGAVYAIGQIAADKPVVLVEGELDCLTVDQAAHDIVTAVATGGTSGGRALRWVSRLAVAPLVLVAYDTDDAGEEAAHFWLDVLPNARRWRAFWGKDANGLAQGGGDVRGWVIGGLR